MTPAELLDFIRRHSLAVQSSVSRAAAPQGAVVGFVVTDRFELFFDTVETTRKVQNLRRNPKIAFVIGGLTSGDERTVQYEGLADEPTGAELTRLKELYFTAFADARDHQSRIAALEAGVAIHLDVLLRRNVGDRARDVTALRTDVVFGTARRPG